MNLEWFESYEMGKEEVWERSIEWSGIAEEWERNIFI